MMQARLVLVAIAVLLVALVVVTAVDMVASETPECPSSGSPLAAPERCAP